MGEIPKLGRNGDSPSLKSFEPKEEMTRVEVKRLINLDVFAEQGDDCFITRQVTHAYCEEGKGVEINVSPYDMFRLRGEETIFGVWGGLEIKLNPQMEFGKEEIEGMKNMFELAEDGRGLILWMSPPGGSYIDARLVAGIGKKLGDRIVIECRGIVISKTSEELLQIARRIYEEEGFFVSEVDGAEDLRSQPIGVNLEGEDWIDFCKRMFVGMDDVWEAIRVGRDIELRDEIESHVIAVREGLAGSGLRGLDLDRAFETGMMMRGYVLPVIGNHGGTSLSMIEKGVFNSVFNEGRRTKIDSKGNVLTWCDQCNTWFEGKNCPNCS